MPKLLMKSLGRILIATFLLNSREACEELPRFSSGNLKDQEIGKSIMDVVLEAGDLLYFPRGTIHQANALPDSHSLHITISCYQKNSWGDLLLKVRLSSTIFFILFCQIHFSTVDIPQIYTILLRKFTNKNPFKLIIY
jgi:hypothetical protein